MDQLTNNLNLFIPINPLGYGVAGLNIAKSLIELGKNVHIHPIGQPDPNLLSTSISKALEDNLKDYQANWPLVKIWHQHALMERIGNGKYYGFPIFELDTFSEQEKYNLKVPDELIVCSNWAKWVIHSNIPDMPYDKVHIVPLGVDGNIFHPNLNAEVSNLSYKFFTIGKLEYRKGHEFIAKCFHKAFKPEDDVELNMMVHNPFLPRELTEQWFNGFKNGPLGSKINFLNPVKSHGDVADFIHSQDCGLFPARAEGWNLELLESMACGKPVIATNYSAHTEYCNKDNAYLIETPDKELAYDKMGGMWFNGQGSWAELDYEQEEQMIEHMRYCFKNRPINTEGIKTAKEFRWETSALKLMEIINE